MGERLRLSTSAFVAIIRAAAIEPRGQNRCALYSDVAIAMAQFRDDLDSIRFTVLPHVLRCDLERIETLARDLFAALQTSREAQNAMVRVAFPRENVLSLVLSPIKRPHFTGLALQIEEAARKAKNYRGPLPYMLDSRGRAAEVAFIKRLIESLEPVR